MPAVLDQLVNLLGTRLDSPRFARFCQQRELAIPRPTAGDSSRVVSDREGGFELYLSPRIANRRFFPPRKDGRAYICYLAQVLLTPSFSEDLPLGVTHTATREAIVAKLGPPARTSPIGTEWFERELAPDVIFRLGFDPKKRAVRDVWIAVQAGHELTASPLHFETMPPEGKPPHADRLATGLLLAWAADRVGLAPELADTPRARQLATRAITGRQFLIDELGGHLLTGDLAAELGEFLRVYTDNLAKRRDVKGYDTDYLASFKKAVPNPYLVPDSWEAFDRLAPILDARWADWQRTRWDKPAPKGIYEAAARKRDAVAVTLATPKAAVVAVAADTTQRLMDIVGRTTSEPEVKALLVSLGLPVGKTVDKQALARLGVSYMAVRPADKSKLPEGAPKTAVVVDAVSFHAKGVQEQVRGLGAEVTYLAYQGGLPRGLVFGEDKASVHAKLGKPSQSSDGAVEWWDYPELGRRVIVRYKAEKTVVTVKWGMPAKWDW